MKEEAEACRLQVCGVVESRPRAYRLPASKGHELDLN